MKSSAMKYKALQAAEKVSKAPNADFDANNETHLLKGEEQEHVTIVVPSQKSIENDTEYQAVCLPKHNNY